jgi:hypothetical protein
MLKAALYSLAAMGVVTLLMAGNSRAEVLMDGGIRRGRTYSRRWPSELGQCRSDGPCFGAWP